jgi:group II intron reverse transcriptase/maturase
MTEVRRPHRPRLPATDGSDHQKPTSLQGRANKAKTDKPHRCRDLDGWLDADLFLAGWRDLNKPAARGVDGLTAQAYEANLQAHITAVVPRLKTKRSRATWVRRGYIPKENGSERPLGIPALADKLVPLAGAKLLMAISEQDFLDCRDGYRPGRGAEDAVRDLPFALQYGTYGYLVDAEVKGFFAQLDHTQLLTRLRERMDDRAFLRLIRQGLQAGIVETDGHVVPPDTGSPQGGSLSPGLANGYLHSALEGWVDTVVQAHCRGEALLGRSADDGGCAFRSQEDAERCYRVFPYRLKRFNLQVAPDNPPLRRFSRFHPGRRRRCTLLGFELYWMPDRQGVPRVKRRTARKTLYAACRRITEGITPHRHLPGRECYRQWNSRLRGHYNYYGLHGNSRSRYRFFERARRSVFTWRTRRGGKRQRFPWEQCTQGWDRRGIARPRITEVKHRRVFACRHRFAPRRRGQPRNRMRENCTSGTARGGPGNRHSYRRDIKE